jgi:CDP-4-dehydro-6-deoxyglucose reductase
VQTIITTSAGKRFVAQPGETLLDAALRGGVSLEHSCRTGRCSSCKAKVLAGTTIALHDEAGLSQAEREAGWILSCVRSATSEAHLEMQDLGAVPLFPSRTWPCRIQTLQRVAADVFKVVLRLPPTNEFTFHPGQYVDVIGPGGLRRSYSVANAPSTDKQIELHIRQVNCGAMSAYWFDKAQVNDLLRLHGPLGTFFLRDIAGMDLVFLATGTGIAPVKAMLEGLKGVPRTEQPTSISVYWGCRTWADLYWHPDASDFELRFVPVLSRADVTWQGARGHVQDALLADAPDTSRMLVYACGSNTMIHSAQERLRAAGLPDKRFHSDAFVCSAST